MSYSYSPDAPPIPITEVGPTRTIPITNVMREPEAQPGVFAGLGAPYLGRLGPRPRPGSPPPSLKWALANWRLAYPPEGQPPGQPNVFGVAVVAGGTAGTVASWAASLPPGRIIMYHFAPVGGGSHVASFSLAAVTPGAQATQFLSSGWKVVPPGTMPQLTLLTSRFAGLGAPPGNVAYRRRPMPAPPTKKKRPFLARFFAGFGDITIPDVPTTGGMKTLKATTGTNCCSCNYSHALQFMLARLGYYNSTIDGTTLKDTIAAIAAYASAKGIANPGQYPSGAFCQTLEDDFVALSAAPPPGPPQPGPPQPGPPGPPQPGPPGGQPLPGFLGKVQNWWGAQSTPMKVGVGAGGVALIVGIAWALGSKKGKTPAMGGAYAPNRRRHRNNPKGRVIVPPRPGHPALVAPYSVPRPTKKNKRRHRKNPKGKVILAPRPGRPALIAPYTVPRPAKRNKRHTDLARIPAKWRRRGLSRSDFAWPEQAKYPLDTAARVRNAAVRFSQFGGRIPPSKRRKVAARIDAAKQRFGIGKYRTRAAVRRAAANGISIGFGKYSTFMSDRRFADVVAAVGRTSRRRPKKAWQFHEGKKKKRAAARRRGKKR